MPAGPVFATAARRGEEAVGVAAIFGMEDEFRQSQQQSGGRLANLIDFLVLDENNPSSIVSSIGAARRNAREERNNITVDVWESLNGLWLELNERLRVDRAVLDRGALIESVKKQAVMIFGAGRPGTAAVVTITSTFFRCSPSRRCCSARSSAESSRA